MGRREAFFEDRMAAIPEGRLKHECNFTTAAIIGGAALAGGVAGGLASRRSGRNPTNIGTILASQKVNAGGFAIEALAPGHAGGISTTNLRAVGPNQQLFAQRFPRSLRDLDTLREEVRPGFSRLRAARLQAIEDARRRAVGNLRENLARRRVLGSSFSQDALARAEREFARESELAAAETFEQEFVSTIQALAAEQQFLGAALDRDIQLLGIATGFGATLTGLSETAGEISAALSAQRAQNTQAIWGTLAGAGSSLLGAGLGSGAGGTK